MTATSHPQSRRKNSRPRKERRVVVRSIVRDPIDTKLFARALVDTILLQMAEEQDAKKSGRQSDKTA